MDIVVVFSYITSLNISLNQAVLIAGSRSRLPESYGSLGTHRRTVNDAPMTGDFSVSDLKPSHFLRNFLLRN